MARSHFFRNRAQPWLLGTVYRNSREIPAIYDSCISWYRFPMVAGYPTVIPRYMVPIFPDTVFLGVPGYRAVIPAMSHPRFPQFRFSRFRFSRGVWVPSRPGKKLKSGPEKGPGFYSGLL